MAGIASGILGTAITGLTGSIMTGPSLVAQQFSLDGMPFVLPTPASIINAYLAGHLKEELTTKALRLQGIDWRPSNARKPGERTGFNVAWDAAIKGALTAPSVDQLFEANARGFIEDADLQRLVQEAHGFWPKWELLLPMYSAYPSLTETLLLRNRQEWTDQQALTNIKRLGFGDDELLNKLLRLRHYIPSVSDLIHFAVKEAFSPEVANATRLYDEHPSSIGGFMAMQGADYDLPFRIRSDGQERPAKLIDLFWAAHWNPLSPSQSYEIFHRLRPSRIPRFRREGFDVQAFTLNDVRRWLRISDYPPGVRDYLAAIAYRPLRLVDIRNAFKLGIIDRNEVKEQFLDRGGHPDDAEISTRLVEKQAEDAKALPFKRIRESLVNQKINHTIDAYEIGIYSRDQAKASLQESGVDGNTAELVLTNADEKTRIKLVKESLRSIRSKFMDGTLSLEATVSALRLLNLDEARARAHIDHWILQRRTNRKVATTAMILSWVGKGIMSPQDGLLRLENLGWTAPDSLIQLAEARNKLAEMQAKMLAAEDKDARTRGKELQQTIESARKETEKMQSALRRISPVSKLQKWLKAEIVTEDFVRQRMLAQGYTPESTELHIKEAKGNNGEGNGET